MRRHGTTRGASRWLLIARLLIMSAVAVAAAFIRDYVDLMPILYIGFVVVGLSVAYFVWGFTGRLLRLLLYVQLVLDVVLITAIARYSGGLVSPFRLLYFLPVVAAAATVGQRGGVAIGILAFGGYLSQALVAGRQAYYYADGTVAGRAVTDSSIFAASLVIVAALVGFVTTRARESEEQLRATRSELDIANLRISNIVHSLGSGLMLVDREGRIVYLNRSGESILGILERDAAGTDYRETLASGLRPIYERIDKALKDLETEMRSEFHIERADGARVPVGMSTSLLADDEGEIRGVVAIFRDITSEKKMEERMRHADRLAALGEFSAGLAHEIRNPLNAIRGSVELLRDVWDTPEDREKLISLVSRETDRLNGVIESFLRFGRMDPGEKERVRLDALVDEVATLAKNHPSYRQGITLGVSRSAPVESFVNAEQVRQAVMNLIINAFEAIDEAGDVRLAVVPGSEFAAAGLRDGYVDEVAIVVADTGCGISEDRRGVIFRPFLTTKVSGTGLGLSIVDKIARTNDGRVVVDSVPGQGSRFVLYLPSERVVAEGSEHHSAKEKAHAPR